MLLPKIGHSKSHEVAHQTGDESGNAELWLNDKIPNSECKRATDGAAKKAVGIYLIPKQNGIEGNHDDGAPKIK